MDISSLISSSCADLNTKYVVLLCFYLVDNISNMNLNDFQNMVKVLNIFFSNTLAGPVINKQYTKKYIAELCHLS